MSRFFFIYFTIIGVIKENHSLYRGLRYTEVIIYNVLFHLFYYYWGTEPVRCIEVPLYS